MSTRCHACTRLDAVLSCTLHYFSAPDYILLIRRSSISQSGTEPSNADAAADCSKITPCMYFSQTAKRYAPVCKGSPQKRGFAPDILSKMTRPSYCVGTALSRGKRYGVTSYTFPVPHIVLSERLRRTLPAAHSIHEHPLNKPIPLVI